MEAETGQEVSVQVCVQGCVRGCVHACQGSQVSVPGHGGECVWHAVCVCDECLSVLYVVWCVCVAGSLPATMLVRELIYQLAKNSSLIHFEPNSMVNSLHNPHTCDLHV